MKRRISLLAALAFLLLGLAQAEGGSLFVTGSTFTDSGGNSPDSFSTTTTLQTGTTSPDGGALNQFRRMERRAIHDSGGHHRIRNPCQFLVAGTRVAEHRSPVGAMVESNCN